MRKKEPHLPAFVSLLRTPLRSLRRPRARHALPLLFTLVLQSVLTLAIALPLTTPRYSLDILEDFFYVAFGCAMLLATLVAHEEHHALTPTTSSSWPPIARAPVPSSTIVLATFSANLLTCSLLELFTLPIPLLILSQGRVISPGHLLTGYLGLLLVQATTIATATFFATLTSRKLLALTLTSLTLIGALIPWMFAPLLPPHLAPLLVEVSFFEGNFQGFMAGRLVLSEIMYYLSMTCFMLTAAITTLRSRRLM